MYELEKTIEISCSHQLNLPYESKCNSLHGHNYKITVYCRSWELDKDGLVVDLSAISKTIKSLDHKHLNDVFDFHTTCENIAKWVCDRFDSCYMAEVCEGSSSKVRYINEEA